MLLATLPATPVQLAHACYRFGFHIVVPASWGDELVAHAVLEDLRERDRDPVIQCTCPLVAERLLANGEYLAPSMVQTASPPVAAARYARQALAPRHLRITYIGACPGAQHTAIDQRFMPDEFLRMLDEQDIALADMPTVFDSVLPPDRRRFESLPGGCPTQEALWQTGDGRMLREVTQPTFSTDLAQTLVWREYVMIDVAPSLGCACAGSYNRLGTRYGRVAVMALEPPRATQPVVTFQPELVAPTVEAPAEPEALNGKAPPETRHEPEETPAEALPVPASREAVDGGASASRVRVRTPSSMPLPRAYLAKRRHLPAFAREPSPQLEPLGSQPVFVSERRATQADVAASPNAEPDVAHTIAVHVEPPRTALEQVEPPPPLEETVAEPSTPPEPIVEEATHAASQPLAAAAPLSEKPFVESIATPEPHVASPLPPLEEPAFVMQPAPPPAPSETELAEESLTPPTSSAAVAETAVEVTVAVDLEEEAPTASGGMKEADEAAEWKPPIGLATEEADSFAPRSGPLRVEVEILEEIATTAADVVIPDVVQRREPREPSTPVGEIITPPARPWGDLLIALWLVLVASAVIASLLWRG